ncbi:MAG: BTAD domain-containing putative transcriptional regulator, partial [Actinomycetota bacterium]
MGVTVRLLGAFSVEIDATTVTAASFERRSGADLVALLALQPHRRLHREQVLDALWPDADREPAMRRLNKASTFARNALGASDAIVVAKDTLTLYPDREVTVDVEQVNAVDLDDPDALSDAVSWVGGPLLPDLPYEEWTVEARNRLHVRQAQVLRAAGAWGRLLELDPTDETAHVAVMEDDLRAGDRDGALRRYDLLADVLDRELGIVPGERAAAIRARALATHVGSGVPIDEPRPARSGQQIRAPRVRTYGRDLELEQLVARFGDGGLVTLVGPGGAGKTHLARLAGSEASGRFAQGACAVELGRVDGVEPTGQATLDAIGGVQGAGMTVSDAVVAALAEVDVLLVLDNCEHVLRAVGPLVDRIVLECPGVTVLATSREPLGIDGEQVVRIAPLDRAAAVDLFVDEAGRHGTALDHDDPAVDRICDRLDDLPMAVRLAAARARSLDLETLEALLADRFEYLGETDPGALAHQQTLQTTIAWSFNALGRATRSFLVALGVFADEFDLDAVAAVTDTTAVERLGMIDELVRRSLLVGPIPHATGPRYRLLESVRIFARDELGDEVRQRHVLYFAETSRRWNDTIGASDNAGLRRFRDGFDDLRIAFGAALELGRRDDALRILANTGVLANSTMRFELLDWYGRALDPAPDMIATVDEARAYAGWSALAMYNGDYPLAARLADAVVETHPGLTEGHWAMALLRWTHGDITAARHWVQQILDDRDRAARTWKFPALHLMTIIDFAHGRDVAENAVLLDVLSSGVGATGRTIALNSRGIDLLW